MGTKRQTVLTMLEAVAGHHFSMVKYGFVVNTVQSSTSPKKFSLSYDLADNAINETILNTVIGTLVKYNSTGRIEPYLVESFHVSNDGLTWSFKFRPNLKCQDGTPINAINYRINLLNIFRKLLSSTKIMEFHQLDGWSEFEKTKSEISGLFVKNDELVFKFLKKPTDFLEILRMPYFGFWKNVDFNSQKPSDFISSGAFRILEISDYSSIRIAHREDWITQNSNAFNNFTFEYVETSQIANTKYDFYELPSTYSDTLMPNNYRKVSAVPTSVGTFVLTPVVGGIFEDKMIRSVFSAYLIENLKKYDGLKYNYFYPSANSYIEVPTKDQIELQFNEVKRKVSGRTIKLAFNTNSYSEKAYKEITSAIAETAKTFNLEVAVQMEEPTETWYKRLISNNEFDIRVAVVTNGAYPKNSIIKMMFCSKLGISFPDPSGKICELVENYNYGDDIAEYIRKFNQILFDDAVVIPIKHFGMKWFISERIDLASFPPTNVSPLFEKILAQ